MITFPNAKINLGLRVTGRRPDGYHNLETVMLPIGLRDILELQPDKEDNLKITGLRLDTDATADNLVFKAIERLRRRTPVPPLAAHLHKNIPAGGGLGGGSADAAFAINLLNQSLGLDLTTAQLHDIAAETGSDCPFFIDNTPSLVTGRGDKVEHIDFDPHKLWLALVIPPLHVSTREAYAGVTPNDTRPSLRDALKRPIDEWENLITNDFEPNIFALHPRLGQIKRELRQLGAAYASMSGSGAVMYGIFRERNDIDINKLEEQFADCRVEALPLSPLADF